LASISIDDAVKEMVQRANEYGGYDNITVIVASVAGSEGEVRQ
jgi:serine/threonine protein phosphatase PrpC